MRKPIPKPKVELFYEFGQEYWENDDEFKIENVNSEREEGD
jgi:hypothetical protein